MFRSSETSTEIVVLPKKSLGRISTTVKIKEDKTMRSSPDSSTDPWGCPQCGKGNASEAGLLEHLLQVHNIRVVPPQSPTTTRCPVCRKHVADLPHHFALEHGENTIKTEEIMEEVTLPNVPNGASITRIIPIVLPNISGSQTQLSDSESNHVSFATNTSYSSGSTRSSTPGSLNNDNPVNLTMRKPMTSSAAVATEQPMIGATVEMDLNSDQSGLFLSQDASQLSRKRRKQTQVLDQNKDERYWARRLKNNEAAKKSRDMRIKREKVIFEENVRLETIMKELKAENDSLSTENKELHLKLGFILEENAHLKSLIQEK